MRGFRMIVYALIRRLADCHRLVWPGEFASPSQIVQGRSERTADFIVRS